MNRIDRPCLLVSTVITAMALLYFPQSLWARPKSAPLVIERLAAGRCLDNLDVEAPKKQGDDTVFADDCVLAFSHPDEDGDGKDAVIRVSGADVQLHVTQKTARYPKAHYVLMDAAGKFRVILDVKESCRDGVEGCDFAGTMTVESSGRSAKLHVVYYRGA